MKELEELVEKFKTNLHDLKEKQVLKLNEKENNSPEREATFNQNIENINRMLDRITISKKQETKKREEKDLMKRMILLNQIMTMGNNASDVSFFLEETLNIILGLMNFEGGGIYLVDKSNKIVAKDHNRCISLSDPTAHAEILVLRKAAKSMKNYRLQGMTMFSTIEPCPMCMSAIIYARLEMVVFGAFDKKAGAAGSIYSFQNNDRFNHRLKVICGIMEEECRELIQGFFRKRR